MTHIQHHLSPTQFEHLDKNPADRVKLISQTFQKHVKALEGTPDMDGKLLGTPEGGEQAHTQMNVNFMQAEFANIHQHILYVPLQIFKQISESQGKAFEFLFDTTHQTLSTGNGSIAPILSDKDDMFMYRTCLGILDENTSGQLEDAIGKIQEMLRIEADMSKNPFFEGLRTSPDDIKPTRPGISVEGYKKAHRVDLNGSFQQQIRDASIQVGQLIEGIEGDGIQFWDWEPQFSFKPKDQYYHPPW